MEYDAATATIVLGGRTLVLVDTAAAECLRALRVGPTAATVTITMRVDASRYVDELLRLYAAANDPPFEALDAQPGWWPAPQPTRPPLHRVPRLGRLGRLGRPLAPRLVSWRVEGRGR